jgi:hypothetical protein
VKKNCDVTTVSTHLHTCTLCEASCGIVVSVDDERIADEAAAREQQPV